MPFDPRERVDASAVTGRDYRSGGNTARLRRVSTDVCFAGAMAESMGYDHSRDRAEDLDAGDPLACDVTNMPASCVPA